MVFFMSATIYYSTITEITNISCLPTFCEIISLCPPDRSATNNMYI